MINLLDVALDKLLNAKELNTAPLNAVFQKLYDADVSFITPENSYPSKLLVENTVNLFLYEVKENRELREPGPTTRRNNGVSVRRRAPLRVDCAYMVTAWSTAQVEPEKVSHHILGLAVNWLSHFPVIPSEFLLAAGLTGQVFAPPTMVAQMDGAKSAGEFWHALGIPPRPYFNLVVTVTMDLDQQIEDSIVTTISSNYHAGQPANGEEHLIIGGTVRDKNGNAVADAWVRLEPLNLTQVTDAAGRFIFENVMRRGGLTLRARASGYPEAERLQLEIPSLSGEYDIKFT